MLNNMETKSNNRTIKGVVISDKMESTVVVAVTRLKKHPKCRKYYKSTRKFKAHDPEGQYHEGDKVLIQETKPMSKTKRWSVVKKVTADKKDNSIS